MKGRSFALLFRSLYTIHQPSIIYTTVIIHTAGSSLVYLGVHLWYRIGLRSLVRLKAFTFTRMRYARTSQEALF